MASHERNQQMGSDHNLYRTIGMGCMVYSYGDAMSEHPIMTDTMLACCGSLGYFLPYMRGEYPPHYPLPAIPEIHQWDYSLWCMLVNIPPMTDEEWEREEEEWQDYLDTLD